MQTRVCLALLALVLPGCAARWTLADKASELAAETDCARIYEHNLVDAGDPFDRVYSHACVCAVQGSLVQHVAGRLVGPQAAGDGRGQRVEGGPVEHRVPVDDRR